MDLGRVICKECGATYVEQCEHWRIAMADGERVAVCDVVDIIKKYQHEHYDNAESEGRPLTTEDKLRELAC